MTPQKCSNCGETLKLPAGFEGGAVVCSNPSCGQSISIGGSGNLGRFGARSTQRRLGTGPILLDRIPRSFVTSAAMLPIGFAIALLYGIVLYGALSTRRGQREAEAQRPRVAIVETIPADPPDLAAPPASATTSSREAIAKEPRTASNSEASPGPAPAQTANASSKLEVASKDLAPPKSAEIAAPSQLPTWGKLSGTLFDCKARHDPGGLSIEIPGTLHVLSSELHLENSPRFLTAVQGDISLSVSIPGDISPGSEPLPNFAFTFHGAGLLLWADGNNYLRFERAESFIVDRGKSHVVFLETCRDGKTSKAVTREVRDTGLSLKIERKGSEFHCQYTLDGRNWIDFRRQTLNLPNELSAGVSASNVSPKPFAARFETFEITDPSAKPAKGS